MQIQVYIKFRSYYIQIKFKLDSNVSSKLKFETLSILLVEIPSKYAIINI